MNIIKNNKFEVILINSFEELVPLADGTRWINNFPNRNLIEEDKFYLIIFNEKGKKRKVGYNFYSNFCFDENNLLIESDIFFKDKEEIKKNIDKDTEQINNRVFEIIKKTILTNQVSYKKIKEDAFFSLKNTENLDLNFIITVRDRLEFAKPLYESFIEASKNIDKKIALTVVEHSLVPKHSKFFKEKQVNYIYLYSNVNEKFNKCLAYNVGALFGGNSKYIIFHDLDIPIQKDFFINIFANLEKNNSLALQCYTNRRVLYCSKDLTEKILKDEIKINDLNEKTPGVSPPINEGKISTGSKGGSILVDSELFYKTGGFDPELFEGYSAEDQFFWEKIIFYNRVDYADDPRIELFHLWHPPQHGDGLLNLLMEGRFKSFLRLKREQKEKIIELKRELLKK